MQPSTIVQYSHANQLLRHPLVNGAGRLLYDNRCAELDLWFGRLLALCLLSQHGSHLF